VERDRCGVVDGLELVVALLEVRLVAVGGQDLWVGELVVVADQREAAIAGGVVADLLGVDRDLEGVVGLGDLAVARVLAGAAALLMAHGLRGGFVHRDGDPALRAGGAEGRGGGLFGGDARADPGARAGQAPAEVCQGSAGALDALAAGGLVQALLAGRVHPDDAMALAGGERCGADRPDVVGVAAALARPPGRLGERGRLAGHPVAQQVVFLAAARQDGDEPSAAAVDVAHLLAGAEL
jgi:hypothetical protein